MDTNLVNQLIAAIGKNQASAPLPAWVTLVGMILVALGPTILSFNAWVNAKAAHVNSAAADKKVDTLTQHVDGRMEELLKEAKASARAEGVTEERARQAITEAAVIKSKTP